MEFAKGFVKRVVTNAPDHTVNIETLEEAGQVVDYPTDLDYQNKFGGQLYDEDGSIPGWLIEADKMGSELFDNHTYYYYDDQQGSIDDVSSILDSMNVTQSDLLPPPLSAHVQIILIVLYSVIICLALLGNGFVVYVVCRYAKMRTVMNLFLLSLAISDAAIAAISMPAQLLFYLRNEWTLGEPACKATAYLQGVFIAASIATLTGVAVDRYYAICYPLRARYVHTTKRASILIAVFWLIALVVMVPQAIIQRLEPLLDIDYTIPSIRIATVCAEYLPRFEYYVAYTIVYDVILYFGPLAVMIVTYVKIAIQLRTRDAISEITGKKEDARQMREKWRVIRMLALIVALFAVCWCPFFIAQIYATFLARPTPFSPIVIVCLQLLGYANCCLNPIVYCLLNEAFKKHLRRLVRCCCGFVDFLGDSSSKTPQPDDAAVVQDGVEGMQHHSSTPGKGDGRTPSPTSTRPSSVFSTKVTSCGAPSERRVSSSRWSSSSRRSVSSYRSTGSAYSGGKRTSGQSDYSKLSAGSHWSEYPKVGGASTTNRQSTSTDSTGKYQSGLTCDCSAPATSKHASCCGFCGGKQTLIDWQSDEIQRLPNSDI